MHEHSLIESLKENLSFVLTALVITALIVLIAMLAENTVLKKHGKKKEGFTAKKIAGIGVFSAIGGVLMILEVSVPLIPGFYMMDFSEVAGMMAAFLLGPVAGVIVEFIKIVIHILIHGTHSAFVGDFASFVLGSIYILPASFIYLLGKTRKRAILGLVTGSLSLIVLGAVFNAVYLIPKFAVLYGVDLNAIISMGAEANGSIDSMWTLIAFATVPFNILKSAVDSVIVFFIYKPLSNLYRRLG